VCVCVCVYVCERVVSSQSAYLKYEQSQYVWVVRVHI